jgi:hypothetical protein
MLQAMSRRLAVLAAVAVALAAPAGAHAADVLTLKRDLVFTASARATQGVDVPFRLPPGARQGPRTWYLVRLHLRVAIAPRSGDGRIYVYGYTNGKACAQIRFDTRRTAAGLRVRSSELGLVSGARERTTSSLVHELTFRNFLLLGGVKAGTNVLTIEVAQREGARVESVRVFANSGIERSSYGPASIALEPLLETDEPQAGKSFRVGFRVRNPSRRAATNGAVRAEPGPGLTVLSRRTVRFGAVPPRGSVAGSFDLEADEPGRFELRLVAESVSGSPVARLAVQVEEASRPAWQWLALALAAAGAAAVALRRRPAVAAGAVLLYLAAVLVYAGAASTLLAFAALLAGSVAAGFAIGSLWALALPLLWPVLALASDPGNATAIVVTLGLAPLGTIPIAVGMLLRRLAGSARLQ